jgi:hypothetical protein
VKRDGEPVFEKSKLGRHAREGEVVERLKGRASSAEGRE